MPESKPYIVVVDDDKDDRKLILDAFSESGADYTLVTFPEGKAVLEYLQHTQNLPALILLDINMPCISGLEVLRILKSDNRLKDIPVIIFSTSTSPSDKKLAAGLHAAGYIVKPDSFEGYINVALELTGHLSCREEKDSRDALSGNQRGEKLSVQ
jgi:CheY-like chemotaxis protein